ncbi:MAG: bifunctional 5,10-methylenetetrahydrofolate dehydrogenase/5,10-methenyltetrahydrofolate cyclohydrolase [Alicyclobacillus sp.]|nr:bifunctional 5,10-methylenetetrahydrofolate dehydrogenase/5,10-methenyltetrahydrofolate cyclohydrolase [Alicyclobacillus sp.]
MTTHAEDTRQALALRGRPVARQMEAEIARRVEAQVAAGRPPKVVTFLVEGDPASACYARAKQRAAAKLGIAFELRAFPPSVSERELVREIAKCNADVTVHGIMLELPLPGRMRADNVIQAIAPEKDIDGLTAANRLANETGAPGLYPATPQACVRLVEHYGFQLAGRHVALVGCGKTVGMPLFHLLLRKNATVTVCHAGTRNLARHLQQAELAFVAVGRAGLVTPAMVHPDLVLVDAGINETADGVVGDVHPAVTSHVAALSPTPGGVGPVTTAQLFANLLQAMELQASGLQTI